jgi:hypothetical protein
MRYSSIGVATGEIRRVHCNSCRQTTNHVVRAVHERELYDSQDDYAGDSTYELLQCSGCDDVSLREYGHYQGHEFETIYPPRISRRPPSWAYQMPHEMYRLIQQIYVALQNGSAALALMGARAIFDMLAVEQVGDVGSFSAKLESLEKNGVISSKNREALEAVVDAGSAAAHRGYDPSAGEVGEVMDILENVLQSVYAHDHVVNRIRKATPQRLKP